MNNPYNEYIQSQMDAIDHLSDIANFLKVEKENIDWCHVGSMEKVAYELSEIKKFLGVGR